jgi:hypothetical protein
MLLSSTNLRAANPPAAPTLALIVGPGERSSSRDGPPTLTIPPGTEQVRLGLTLREHDYARYRVIVRAIGGAELLRQSDLVAAGGAGPAFAITIPATSVDAGDYMPTLQGASTAGEFEDLSQTLFRVNRPGAQVR